MVAASDAAPQHAPYAPRPLPLFLDLARRAAADDPQLLARILRGVRRYETAPREVEAQPPSLQLGPLRARFAGDTGPWVVLVPSLINPAWIMDLDAERSLLRWLGSQGFRVALLDWESVPDRRRLGYDLADHITQLLIPAITALGEAAHVIGYCLGGILAAGAAMQCRPLSLTMLATPWHFDRYPIEARSGLQALWNANKAAVDVLGAMPMELLQSTFWNLDPDRTVRKFAAIADRDDDDPVLHAFVRLEDWANGGDALSARCGHDLFDGLFATNSLAAGQWKVGGVPVDARAMPCRMHQFTAAEDRIAPANTGCDAITATACPSGHVGMIVGQSARAGCWEPLAQWLAAPDV